MKDIRVDSEGEFRCWNCGNKGLIEKRTFRSKALIGVGALLTKKKLKCQTCGEYNDTGSAKPYTGPAARKWRKVWEKNEQAKSMAQVEAEARGAQVAADAIAAALLTAAQGMTAPAFEHAEATVALPSPPTGPPRGWLNDPTGRHELRYWDGDRWTEHVSDAGIQGSDPA